MFDTRLGYDPASPDSIEHFAEGLKDKTFYEVISENSSITSEDIESYANKLRKGGLGNLLEEGYFGYKANSKQESDFPEAGVELKATPFEYTKKGQLRAGERLVITMINYDGPIEDDFYHSHAWDKMHLILLVYYWRNKTLKRNLDYKIKYVQMFTPPEQDLAIIKKDYEYIVKKIQDGKAHELSEGDTMYLGACTKGSTAKKSIVPQFYGDKLPAKKRAFCLKNSYMTYVLNHYIAGKDTNDSIVKNVEELKKKSFSDILKEIVNKYIGMSDKELCKIFHREYNDNKAQWNDLAFKILGVRNEHADEFEKANIRVKTIRINENNSIRENMSFSTFKFMDIANEEFDDSDLYEYFDQTQLFFFVWVQDGDLYRVKGCQLWNMLHDDLEHTVRKEWEDVKRIINEGVKFTKCINSNGEFRFKNNFPNKKQTQIIHIRPHSKKAAYRFKNGEEYGNVNRDAYELPNGEYMTKMSFWLNNDYVLKQLNCIDQK